MKNTYNINNSEMELVGLLSKVILDSVEKNGTDILLGKYNVANIKNEKEEFDKICRNGISVEPELQLSMSKYIMNNKEYYHIEIGRNLNSNKNIFHDDETLKNITKKDTKKKHKKEIESKIKLTDRQCELIKIIEKNPYIKYEKISDLIGVSKGTICIDIKLLKKIKILEREGTNNGKWIINKALIDT